MNIPKIAPKTLIVIGSVCGGTAILYLYGKLCYISGVMSIATPLLEELSARPRRTRYVSYH